jgi:phage terminase small subunit
MGKKPALKLVRATGPDPNAPPSNLREPGAKLWRAVMSEYDVQDAGGLAMLAQACEACDRLEALAEHIRNDGEIVRTKAGPKDHPALKHELANRAFIVRTLSRLGLDVEAIKPMGRLPGRGV